MPKFRQEVQRALKAIDQIENIETTSLLDDCDVTEALGYFCDPEHEDELVKLILCNSPQARNYGLFIADEMGNRIPKDFIHKLKSLEFSSDRSAFVFLLNLILHFNHDDEWSGKLIARTLCFPNEDERVRAIIILLTASDTALKRVLNASIADLASIAGRFETARALLNFSIPQNRSLSNVGDGDGATIFRLYERTRIRSLQIVLQLKLGVPLNEVEANTVGEGSYVFDYLRLSFNLRKINRISLEFLDESLK